MSPENNILSISRQIPPGVCPGVSIISIFVYYILLYFKDAHPILDSLTTVFSIGGMYLTVRRAIQQWIFWMFVNVLSLIMWINVILNGTKAYSTAIMWAVYVYLAIYFYIEWRKELKQNFKHDQIEEV